MGYGHRGNARACSYQDCRFILQLNKYAAGIVMRAATFVLSWQGSNISTPSRSLTPLSEDALRFWDGCGPPPALMRRSVRATVMWRSVQLSSTHSPPIQRDAMHALFFTVMSFHVAMSIGTQVALQKKNSYKQ